MKRVCAGVKNNALMPPRLQGGWCQNCTKVLFLTIEADEAWPDNNPQTSSSTAIQLQP